MTPELSNNLDNNRCPNPTGSDCITVSTNIPGLNLCQGASLTQALLAEANLVNSTVSALNLTGLNLGCLYQTTIQIWTCPTGQTFGIDPSAFARNGTPGYCSINNAITTSVPVLITTPNPVPPPTTLAGILQLMINKIPCCDPCSSPNLGM